MEHGFHGFPESYVAPRAGAWIEMISGSTKYVLPVSLPVRERGLKYQNNGQGAICSLSLPVRERGLKWNMVFTASRNHMSLPVRERGLKSDRRGVS